MNKENKLILSLAIGYAIVGFNTFGYRYHRDYDPEPLRRTGDAAFCGIGWPIYWPARWSLLFWEPRPAAATNTVYVTNYIERLISYNVLPHYAPLPNNDIVPRLETNWSLPNGNPGSVLVMTNNQRQWLSPN